MKFEIGFARFVCGQLPIGLLDEMAHTYYGHGIVDELPEDMELRQALDEWKSGDKLT